MTNLQPLPADPPPSVRDWGLSWVRTAVPVLWGFLLTFAATRVPAVYALLADNIHVYAFVEAVVTAAWYGLFRWLESHLPPWLTRFLLGANTQPRYPLPDVEPVPESDQWRGR